MGCKEYKSLAGRRLISLCLAAVEPQVVAYKKSEHGNEGDVGVLTCKSPSYPPVDHWAWYKSGQTVVSAAVFCPPPPLLTNKRAEVLLLLELACQAILALSAVARRASVVTALRGERAAPLVPALMLSFPPS